MKRGKKEEMNNSISYEMIIVKNLKRKKLEIFSSKRV